MSSTQHIRIRRLSLVSLCAATTAVGALITIPLPIPITMQLFGVFLSGFLLGPLWGAVAQLVYIIVGLIGLPVFAGGMGGLSILASPTLGYLMAFPAAAAVVGFIGHGKSRSMINVTAAIGCGMALIYAAGVCYLWWWSYHIAMKPISIKTAILTGALPFLAPDALKGYLAVIITRAMPNKLSVVSRQSSAIDR